MKVTDKKRINIKVNSGEQAEEAARAAEEQVEAAEVVEAPAEPAVDYEDRYLRLAAEFENYKKRSERDKAEFLKRANEALVGDLLPALDNLERAVEASGESADGVLRQGVEMVLGELVKVLGKYGLEVIDAVGQPFDPQLHEAMMQQETPDAADGTVLSQYQKGYRYQDRLLRPAMVVVAKSPE